MKGNKKRMDNPVALKGEMRGGSFFLYETGTNPVNS
jgi:hypothetical protein